MNIERIGIYGGTFDPPHKGHIQAVRTMLSCVSLDTFLVIPTNLSPKKEFTVCASAEDRLQMATLAFSDIDARIHISDMEFRRGGMSYTADTLEELSAPHRTLFFLCGSDMFLLMDRWHDAERIFKLAHICCICRKSDPYVRSVIGKKAEEYRSQYRANIRLIPSDPLDISSGAVRAAVRDGADLSACLTPPVIAYIREKGLYTTC